MLVDYAYFHIFSLLLFSNNVVSFLWLNLIGAILTVIFALFLQIMLSLDNKKVNT